MSESIFTKIVKGEIPAHKVYEDEKFLAFLDIRPKNPGHTLVIPKQEIDDLFDLPDDLYAGLMALCRKIARVIQKATNPLRVGVIVYGLDVPHAHVHLIPIHKAGDLRKEQIAASNEELTAMAEKIKSYLY